MIRAAFRKITREQWGRKPSTVKTSGKKTSQRAPLFYKQKTPRATDLSSFSWHMLASQKLCEVN